MSTRNRRRRTATLLLTTSLLVAAAVASAQPPPEGIDPDYGGDGLATIGGTRANFFRLYADASATAPGGKLVVAGRRQASTSEKVGVARFLASGAADLNFGDKGLMVFDSDPNSDFGGVNVCDVVVQPDGRVVLSTTGPATSGSDVWLHRFEEDGDRDLTFSGDGKLRIDWGQGEPCAEIALRPDGKIVVVTNHTVPFSFVFQFALARVLPNGTLDKTFDADEAVADRDGTRLVIVTERRIWLPYEVRDIALQGAQGDKIVVVGRALLEEPSRPPNSFVARFTAAGRPDTTFRPESRTSFGGWLLGPTTTDWFDDVEVAPATEAHPYEKLVVLGGEIVFTASEAYDAAAVGRLRANNAGTAWVWDTSFSGDGLARRPPPTTPIALALDDTGGVVAAGYDWGRLSSVLWRYDANGAVDNDYGGNGTVDLSQQCYWNSANADAACLQPVGIHGLSGRRVLVAGHGNECPKLECPTFATPPTGLPSRFASVRVVADPLPAVYAETVTTSPYEFESIGTYDVRVRLTSPSVHTVTVSYETVPGASAEATAPRDYVHRAGTLTFQPGQVQKTVSITVKNDNKYEGPATVAEFNSLPAVDRSRTFTFRLLPGSTTGATVPITDTPLGIVDDETPPSVAFGSASSYIVEVSESETQVVVPVRLVDPNNAALARPSSRQFWVDVSTASPPDSAATPGEDYEAVVDHRVTVPAGDTTGSLTITLLPDSNPESVEFIRVDATATSMGHHSDTLQNWIGYVQINDDDPPGT